MTELHHPLFNEQQEPSPHEELLSCPRCGHELGSLAVSQVIDQVEDMSPATGHALDLPPPKQEPTLTSMVPQPIVHSPIHRERAEASEAHRRLHVRGRSDIRIYVLGSKPEPPSDLDLRFVEFVASTTPEERANLAEDRRGRLAGGPR